MLTQCIEKGCPRIQRQQMEPTIDLKFDAYRRQRRFGVGCVGRVPDAWETAEQESGCDGSGFYYRPSSDPKTSVSVFIHGWRPRSLLQSTIRVWKRLWDGCALSHLRSNATCPLED